MNLNQKTFAYNLVWQTICEQNEHPGFEFHWLWGHQKVSIEEND